MNIFSHSYYAIPIGLMLIVLDVGVVATTPLSTKVTPMVVGVSAILRYPKPSVVLGINYAIFVNLSLSHEMSCYIAMVFLEFNKKIPYICR